MVRKNDKRKVLSYEDSIKKSNEFSMAKLNQGLTLNQMQLLAYAIFSTQQDGKTEFIKADFEKKFSIEKYQTAHAKQDAQKLLGLQFSIEDLENNYFEYWNVFQKISYKDGLFTFKWSEDMIPHIHELKENYITNGFTIIANFKSGFSFLLYDFLKAHYGYWHKSVSKDALMRLFGVEDRKTYQSNTSRFKAAVLDVAIKEINKYTELDVWYKEEKKGRAITGFVLHWSTGDTITGATEGQIKLLRMIQDTVMQDMMKYLALKDNKNLDEARTHILALNEIDMAASKGLTAKQADMYIRKANLHFNQLEKIYAKDQEEKFVFYNWLEERE